MSTVLSFGEILWDFLPDGLFAGGAPLNSAYHLHRHGHHVHLVSGVGKDLLGDELVRRIRAWGLDTETLTFHQGLPTGYVRAEVSTKGDAHYDIVSSVAWDQILVDEDVVRAAVSADALVFGSLAQRTPVNRAALDRLLTVLPDTAWRVFDVNLRAPYDDLDRVGELAPQATLLKLNAEEASRLATGHDAEDPGNEESHARTLAERLACPMICVTAGARGAGLLRDGKWHWEPGRDVVVADTVGAGDSFLAALVSHLLSEKLSDGECVTRACRLGEWVASKRGATPAYDSSTPSTSSP